MAECHASKKRKIYWEIFHVLKKGKTPDKVSCVKERKTADKLTCLKITTATNKKHCWQSLMRQKYIWQKDKAWDNISCVKY